MIRMLVASVVCLVALSWLLAAFWRRDLTGRVHASSHAGAPVNDPALGGGRRPVIP